MHVRQYLISALAAVLFCAVAIADELDPTTLPTIVQDCVMCHDDTHLNGLFSGPHAVAADPRTRFATEGCGSCHGPSEAHMRRPPRGEPRALPDVVFGVHAELPMPEQNAACLDCHRADAGLHWSGSDHDFAGLGCVSCHRSHAESDPVLHPVSEAQVCFNCHQSVRSETLRPSVHPLHDGQMACSDCHAVHGSIAPSLLKGTTVNDSCTTCHADLRGPFLWEHPPVSEDCLGCHQPHGAVHAPLLKQRGPWLCQNCHLAQFHPSTALSGTGLPGDTLPSGSSSMLGQNCMNCHVTIHGSNHPSGAGFTR